MRSRIGNWTRRLIVLGIAASSATGCEILRPRTDAVCPPVVEYAQPLRDQAANELDLLPENSAIETMLADYFVLREQALACRD